MPTLADYRKQIASADLHAYQEGQATEGSSNSVLEMARAPFKSSRAIDSQYEDWYIHRPDSSLPSDRVRSVNSYNPLAGQFYPDLAYTEAPALGEKIELHGMIEPATEVYELINAALKRVYIVVTFAFSPMSSTVTRHNLTALQPWLKDDRLVRQVGFLASGQSVDEIDPFSKSARGDSYSENGEAFLHIGAVTPQTVVWVRALKPAYYHCRPFGGVYGSQSGLQLDSDESPVAEDLLAAGALIDAWRSFGHLLETGSNSRLFRDQAQTIATFNALVARDLQVPSRTLRRIGAWGPR